MIQVYKNFNFTVNFSNGKFTCNEKIILIENDNKSIKFLFNFTDQNINDQSVILKFKHYTGFTREKALTITDNAAEFVLTNDVLVPGVLKMSISLVGTSDEVLTVAEYIENIQIKESLGDGEEPSAEELSALTQVIANLNAARQNGTFNGESAYQVAVNNGFEGTEEQWINSLKGDTGNTGNGISEISKISTVGLVNTYRILFTNGTSFDFSITDGERYDDTEIRNEIEELKSQKIFKFGVRIYHGQSATTCTRLGDAVGLVANASKNGQAVRNDFDSMPIFRDIRKVKRHKTTHKLLAIKGDADYDLVDGEEMVDFPDTYWKFEEAEDKSYLDMWVSNAHISGYSKVDKFSVGAVPLSIDGEGNLQTKSGFVPGSRKGIIAWRTAVKTNYGDEAALLDWHYDLILNLYLIEFADFSNQAILGNGHCSHRNSWANDKVLLDEQNTNRVVVSQTTANYFNVGENIQCGTSADGGQIFTDRKIVSKENYSDGTITGVAITVDGTSFNVTNACGIQTQAQECGDTNSVQASSGCMSNDGKHGVMYRGFERNSIFDWIDGINIKNGVIYQSTDPSKYASNKYDDSYEALSYGVPNEGVNSGYIKRLGFDKNHPFCKLQKEYGGGSLTHITDYGYSNPDGERAALVGGSPTSGAYDGLFYWNLNHAPSTATWYCGARVLMYQI